MTRNFRKPTTHRQRAFSLVELLFSVAFLAILSLIVVPTMASAFRGAETAKDKRNAQTLAHAAAALTAGGDETLPSLDDKSEALAYLASLALEEKGERAIGVPYLSEEELQAAGRYLNYAHGLLSFQSDPAP